MAGAVGLALAERGWAWRSLDGAFLMWFYETGQTTCARCAYYGTVTCGLPGLIAPMLTERKAADSLPPARIRSHLRLDLWILVFLTGLYALQRWLLPWRQMTEPS